MPIKKFFNGDVLTAEELNTYLMDQSIVVFANAAARDLAFSDNDPALPELGGGGRLCYLADQQVIQYFNGDQWVESAQFSIALNSQVSAGILQLDRLVSASPGQVIVCNSSGVPTYVSLSGDVEISASGEVTIKSDRVALGTDTTGNYVSTIAGTTNQINVNGSGVETAAITLSLPQDIHTAANPTFAGATIDTVRIGVTAANEVDTTSGNLILDSAGGTVSVDDNISVSGSAAVTGNVVYHISTASVASGGSILSSNDGQLVELTGNNATLTVPGSGWTIGSQITIMQMGTGSASITFTGASDIKATPRVSANVVALRTQYSTVTIINRGVSDWYVIGDLRS